MLSKREHIREKCTDKALYSGKLMFNCELPSGNSVRGCGPLITHLHILYGNTLILYLSNSKLLRNLCRS